MTEEQIRLRRTSAHAPWPAVARPLAHTHVPGPTPSPSDAAQFNAKAAQALQLAGKLKPITA
jgi:hypothetical protein